ncbi:MAG TPA: MerR family transcriptional regulator [Gemmataceae bacterium]|nr:MerR family transcriptional regulator [Gemmataceae bacterium]
MNAPGNDLWTLEELAAQVALALAVDYTGQENGSVRDVPDGRTIRYYTTLGLIDRPTQMRGRTALYGRRHLLQLVAIKRLQAKGQTLAQLQTQLVGLTDNELAAVAKLPAMEMLVETPPRRDATFWTQTPAPVEKRDPAEPVSGQPLQGVTIAPDVTLLVNAARNLEPDDIEAIRVVAAPLLKLLETRRLR